MAMVFGSIRLLADANAATVVPYSSAMPNSVSPGATLTVVALEGTNGDATAATVKAVPMIASRAILRDRPDIAKITASMLDRESDDYKRELATRTTYCTHSIATLGDQHHLIAVRQPFMHHGVLDAVGNPYVGLRYWSQSAQSDVDGHYIDGRSGAERRCPGDECSRESP